MKTSAKKHIEYSKSGRKSRRRSGQSLIGVLIVMLIAIGIYMLYLGKRRGENGEEKQSILKQSMDKGSDVNTSSNILQIQQAVELYKNSNDGKVPASLDELKNSAEAKGYPAEMWIDSVSKQPLNYDPQTGRVSSPTGGLPGVPGSAPRNADSARGNDLPGVPGEN